SVADLTTHEVTVGVSGANSTPAFFTRLLNTMLGTKMKPINGYPGQNDVLLAMERGEVDGHPSAFFSSVRTTRPGWLREKTARAILQYGPKKLAELDDVPFAPDLVAKDDDRLVMQAAFAPLALGRPFLAPPGVPNERVVALRKAFALTMADPDFLAEAETMGLGVNAPRTGEQMREVMERVYRTPPRVIDRLRQLNVPSMNPRSPTRTRSTSFTSPTMRKADTAHCTRPVLSAMAPVQLLRMRKISTSPSRALAAIVSPVSRNKFGMSMAVRGSVHSAISMSPAFNPVRALRARSVGKGHLSPRKLSIFSATTLSLCAPGIARVTQGGTL